MLHDTTPAVRPRDRAVSRFVLVSAVLPVVIVAAGLVALVVAAPHLPDPVAIHWGAGGEPDGFGPLWLTITLLAALGLGIPALLCATTLPPLRRGDRGRTYPFLAATSLGLTTFLTLLVTISTVGQAGLDVAADAPGIGFAMAVSAPLGLAAGVVGWFLQPRDRFVSTTPDAAPAAELGADEHAVWLQRVSIARSGLIVLLSAVALLVVVTALTWSLAPDPLAQVVTVGATLFVGAAVGTNVVFHVRVDATGLTVTSAAGWPRVHVPLSDVAEAARVSVEPMGEFGGWGMRWAAGRFGVVLRRGEGIQVRRRSGKIFVVTVDDAEVGAALLNAFAARG